MSPRLLALAAFVALPAWAAPLQLGESVPEKTTLDDPEGRPLVDSFVTEVSQDTWIYFPWDLAPHANQPLVKQR